MSPITKHMLKLLVYYINLPYDSYVNKVRILSTFL